MVKPGEMVNTSRVMMSLTFRPSSFPFSSALIPSLKQWKGSALRMSRSLTMPISLSPSSTTGRWRTRCWDISSWASKTDVCGPTVTTRRVIDLLTNIGTP